MQESNNEMVEEDIKPLLKNTQDIPQDRQPTPGPSSSTLSRAEVTESDDGSLANLTCSICLGPPSPLVVTQ